MTQYRRKLRIAERGAFKFETKFMLKAFLRPVGKDGERAKGPPPPHEDVKINV